MSEKAIFTNMCMIYDKDNILVQERLNPNWSGITFPGGHVNLLESFVDSTIREVYEETGLKVSNLNLCGIKQFTYGEENIRYVVVFYKTNTFSGELKSSEEGKVFWINKKDLSKYKLAEGFKEMFEVFENDDLSENFHFKENNKWNAINK